MNTFFDGKTTQNGVILAVSGGIDSMTLLVLALREIPDKIKVVTVNHHLRKSAEKDVKFVKNFCDSKSVPCVIADIYPKHFAEENGLSIETAARILRYDALSILSEGKPICLAHNKNDQAETVLMHIARGSGNKGAVGMNEKGKFLRPMLGLTRGEIEKIAETEKIPYITDETNSDNRYMRNYVRNKILPLFKALNPNSVNNISRFSKLSEADEDYFTNAVNEIYPKLDIKIDGGKASIGQDVFTLHPALKNRVLIRVFNELGYDKDIEQIHLNELDNLYRNTSGKKLSLPFDLIAVKSYNVINIFPSAYLQKTENICEIPFCEGKSVISGTKIEIGDKPNGGLYFDADKMPPDAVIRFRKDGDVFCKFGGGTKKLKEYFIDKKIPLLTRDKIPLIASGNEIMLIFNIEISDKIKTDSQTQKTLFAKIVKN